MATTSNTTLALAEPTKVTKMAHLEYMKYLTDVMIQIAIQKNSDYTSGSSDPFHNFRTCEAMGIASAKAGILIRMTDKMARLCSLVNDHKLQVTNEKIEDTLIDLANYSLILCSYIYHEKRENSSRADV
jgi:hypothetical protein